MYTRNKFTDVKISDNYLHIHELYRLTFTTKAGVTNKNQHYIYCEYVGDGPPRIKLTYK